MTLVTSFVKHYVSAVIFTNFSYIYQVCKSLFEVASDSFELHWKSKFEYFWEELVQL